MYNPETLVAITKLGWKFCPTGTQTKNMTLVFEKDGQKVAAYRTGYIRKLTSGPNFYTGRRHWYQINKKPYSGLNGALTALLAYILRNSK